MKVGEEEIEDGGLSSSEIEGSGVSKSILIVKIKEGSEGDFVAEEGLEDGGG